jgi:hypothetical protein
MAHNRDIRENALFTMAKREIPYRFLIAWHIISVKDLNILNFY